MNQPGRPGREDREDEGWPTHLADKAQQAVDMTTGAIVAVTLQGADMGDTTKIEKTHRGC